MARKAAAAKPVLVHPHRESRIARASTELTGPTEAPDSADILKAIGSAIERYGVRPLIAALELHKTELSERLLKMVKLEGEAVPDAKGVLKIRYETEKHKYQVIPGKNVFIGEGPLRAKMTGVGITPKVQDKILNDPNVRKVTEYEYVGVYKKEPTETEE